jgi:hypothetical protein
MTLKKNTRSSCKGGGGVLGGVVSALKTALPSIVLYEALKMQGRRVAGKGHRGSRRSKRVRGKSKKSRRGRGSRKSRRGRGSRKSRRGRGSRRRR